MGKPTTAEQRAGYTLRDLADISMMHLELAARAWAENDPFEAQAHAMTSIAATLARTSGAAPEHRDPSPRH